MNITSCGIKRLQDPKVGGANPKYQDPVEHLERSPEEASCATWSTHIVYDETPVWDLNKPSKTNNSIKKKCMHETYYDESFHSFVRYAS